MRTLNAVFVFLSGCGAFGPIEPPDFCTCESDFLNCDDFSSSGQAQACFDFCLAETGADVHNLDGNNDGEACE